MLRIQRLAKCAAGFTVVGGLLLGDHVLSAAVPQATRTVHVSVTTNEGVPVTDLTPADFEVKEDGKLREIASVEITPVPIRMRILVADDGTGAFQQALVTLLQPLQAIVDVSLVSVIAQPETILDFTRDSQTIVNGIEKLGTRASGTGGSQLMEALTEAASTMTAPGRRPVIVVMRLGGSAPSSIREQDVRNALRKAGTRLYVLSPAGHTGGGGGAPMAYGGAGGGARADFAASEATYRSRNLESVVNDGSKETGGRHLQFSASTIVPIMEQLAQELQSQYLLTYTLPAGVKPSDRLEVATTRRGLRVYAPTRVAN
jgi:VWFA-related protein